MAKAGEPARGANIFDVARLAGVSHQTVSRVLNNSPSVRASTRERVQVAIKQLRYQPSPAARALVSRRSRAIGVVTPGSADYGPSSIQVQFNAAATAARYSVLTTTATDSSVDGVRTAIESLLQQHVEAVVLVLPDATTLDSLRILELGIPLVPIASGPDRGPLAVSVDQYGGARMAVRHLLDSGYRDIAHIAGPADHPDAIERRRGWADELAEASLPRAAMFQGDWTAASGYAAGLELPVRSGTAVFASNDQIALGVLAAALHRGVSVPDELGVVGFDDIPDAAYFSPSLTTVRQNFEALGKLALQRVLNVLERPDDIETAEPLSGALIVRNSTARSR